MKKIIAPLLIFTMLLSSCSTLNNLGIAPTALESIQAVKALMDGSSFRAINALQKMNAAGGVEGLLPKEIAPVLKTLKTLGVGKEVDGITKQINGISKMVAGESAGIMKDAISSIKITDAVGVVLGAEDAATMLLKNAMYGSVKKRYSERLDTELAKTEVPQYWPMATGAYNLFAKNKVDNDLSGFLAERAVDALFLTMGKQEKQLRKDPKKLQNAVVNKVFDYYQKKKGR